MSADALCDSARAYFAGRRRFNGPPVSVQRIGRFQAFAFSDPCPEMDDLAAACVTEFDRFRAPPGAAELAKRRGRGLSNRQEGYLQAWGYPYVMAEFRFHMTMLVANRDEAVHEAVTAYLAPRAARFTTEPLPVDAVCIYRQETREAPFLLVERFPFGS